MWAFLASFHRRRLTLRPTPIGLIFINAISLPRAGVPLFLRAPIVSRTS
jgi:hypothetical protein